MATLLLTFANSDTKHLDTLTDEYHGVLDALNDRISRQDFTVISRAFVTRPHISGDIRTHKDDLCLFLYSGHAYSDRLILEDGDALGNGVAALLGNCPGLIMVILNGCSTAGQVKSLFDNNIPIVVATSSSISDKTATQFSIAFFKELAHGISIRGAFDQAIKEASVYGIIEGYTVEDSRGFGRIAQKDKDKPLWGLYYDQSKEMLLDNWQLPIKNLGKDNDKINSRIRSALLSIAKTHGIAETEDATLNQLPFAIHEPIRKLLSLSTPFERGFYDIASWERFMMLLYAYRSIINLTTFTLLAELWKQHASDTVRKELPENIYFLIKNIFFNSKDIHRSSLDLLKELGGLLADSTQDKESFLFEISLLLIELSKERPKNALNDLELKINNQGHLEREFVNPLNKLRICLETEKSFSVVLKAFDFWANYRLISVKHIELLNYHHLKSYDYSHQILTLQNGKLKTDPSLNINPPLNSSSIMLHRHGKLSSARLSLSPFLIDKNAFGKAPKADLYYMLSFFTEHHHFLYREVTSFDKVEPCVPGREKDKYDDEEERDEDDKEFSEYYPLLKDQITAFAQTVLKKSLDEL